MTPTATGSVIFIGIHLREVQPPSLVPETLTETDVPRRVVLLHTGCPYSCRLTNSLKKTFDSVTILRFIFPNSGRRSKASSKIVIPKKTGNRTVKASLISTLIQKYPKTNFIENILKANPGGSEFLSGEHPLG